MRREKEEQRKRKIERALNEESEPKKKHFLEDPNYVSETAALVESVASAVDEGSAPLRVRGRCARLLLMNLFGRTEHGRFFPSGLLQSQKIEAELAEKKAKEQAAVHKAAKKLGMWYVHILHALAGCPTILTVKVCRLVRHQGRGGAERQQRRGRRQERQRSGLCEQRWCRQQPCKQGLNPCK